MRLMAASIEQCRFNTQKDIAIIYSKVSRAFSDTVTGAADARLTHADRLATSE